MASAISTEAATTVLYQTGWEAAPAAPAWLPGAINGQNLWQPASGSGFLVVSNGAPNAIVNGQAVTTPYGNQFVRITANASTSSSSDRFSWPDISAAFTARPSGQNRIRASFDVLVPSVQAADSSWYGIRAFHENSVPWGLFVEADDHSINLRIGDGLDYVPDAFDYDTWFNVAVIADYDTGDLTVEKNGVTLPISGKNPAILSGTLIDVDLWSINSTMPPTVRAVFIDNYRVIAEGVDAPKPNLTIQPGAAGGWHISWGADFSQWILESTQNPSAATWDREGIIPAVGGGIASVDIVKAPPQTFFRLRKP